MNSKDRTDMGGKNRGFLTTRWTQIMLVKDPDVARRRDILGALFERYWKPIYCYLRRKGHGDAQAKDLTQGFFQEAVLRRNLMEKADPEKGRFRTFLLSALETYVRELHRKETAWKRGGNNVRFHLDKIPAAEIPRLPEYLTPEDSFNLAWASELLEDVLNQVRRECRRENLGIHWELFCARVLYPITEGRDPVPIPRLRERFDLPTDGRVSNMIVAVKRRFQAAFRRTLRKYVDREEDVDVEIDDLMKVLSKKSARS